MNRPRKLICWPTIFHLGERYELRLRSLEFLDADKLDPEEEARAEERRFFDVEDAERFFIRLLMDPSSAFTVRRFATYELREIHPWSQGDADDFQLAQSLARSAVVSNRFRVVLHRNPPVAPVPKEPERPPPPFLAPLPEQSWVGIQVVWDDSGEPIVGLPLVVEVPGNAGAGRSMRETGADGLARFEIPPGPCEARCSFKGLTAADCANFAEMAESDSLMAAGKRGAPRRAPKAIVRVETRRARSGETLEGVAQEAGLTWQELAQFNFGTRSRDEVNERLAAEVGCTKKSADGKSYVFHDDDLPGTLFVPRQWRAQNLAPARTHVIRVRPPAFRFSICVDQNRKGIARKAFRILKNGALLHAGQTDSDGWLTAPFRWEEGFEAHFPVHGTLKNLGKGGR